MCECDITVNGIRLSSGTSGWYPDDFEDKLIQLGVPEYHLKNLKKKILTGEPEFYKMDGLSSVTKIPTNKIIGVVNNESENTDVFFTIKHGISSSVRFYCCLRFLNGKTLDELYVSYANMPSDGHDCVEGQYYPDLDGYYITNGRHRALTALLVGAPFIGAKITNYIPNVDQKNWHRRVKDFYDDNHEIVIIKKDGFPGKVYSALLPYKDKIIQSYGYDLCFEAKDRNDILYRLEEKIKADRRIIEKLLTMPKILRYIFINIYHHMTVWNMSEKEALVRSGENVDLYSL